MNEFTGEFVLSKFLSVIFVVMNTEKILDPIKRNGSFEQLKDLSNVVGPHGIGFGFFKIEKNTFWYKEKT